MTDKATLFAAAKIEKLRAIKDHVLITDMGFTERLTQNGIILVNDNGKSEGIRPRWGQVYAVGPEQQDVTVGQWIMVEHGRWTRGVDIETPTGKKTVRRVDNEAILLVSDEEPQDETMSTAILA